MQKYRVKPLTIEAKQWKTSKDNIQEVKAGVTPEGKNVNVIKTPLGEFILESGMWIIKLNDEFYVCKDNIFQATYERIEDE